MKIVIGGASGLIGKRLVRRLRERGDEVVALVRRAAGSERWAHGATVAEWDGKTRGPWVSQLDGADAVINLAGVNVGGKRWDAAHKQAILDSRVDSTRAIVAAIAAAGRKPRTFVSASAVGYYGGRGDELLDETAAPGSDFLAGVVKAWEAEARLAEAQGVRVVLMRTGVVLAPEGEGGALQQMLLPFKAFVGGPIGSGKQWFPWIHLDDEVSLFLWALDHDEIRGPLNATAPGVQTMKGFCKTLGKVMHRPSWAPVPAAVLKLAVGEFASVLLDGQRTVPAVAQRSGFKFQYPESEPALANLLGAR